MSFVFSVFMGMAIIAPAQTAPVQGSPPKAASSQPHAPDTAASPKDRRLRPVPLTLQQVIEHLGLIKGNNTPEARKLGAMRLLETGTPDAIQKLSSVLTEQPSDLAAQIGVCEAAAFSEAPAPELIPPLLALLGDKRPRLSEAVINTLSRFESQAVLERLGPMAADQSLDVEKRLAAINALGVLSDNFNSVGFLVRLLEDPSPTVRAYALLALRQAINEEFPDSAAAQEWWKAHEMTTVVEWLRRRNDQKAINLRKLATDTSAATGRLVVAYREAYHRVPEGERSRRVLSLLGDTVPAIRQLGLDLINDLITDRKDISQEIKSRLSEILTDPNAAVRLQATKIAGDLRLPGAFARLSLAILHEADPGVRVAQVNAISHLDDVGVIDSLLERLDDDVPAVVGEAALALGRVSRRSDWGRLGAGQSSASIPQALADRYAMIRAPQDELREQFLVAIASIGDPRFRPIFHTEINAPRSARVRRAAIAGIAGYGDTDAAEAVRACLSDGDAEIRLAAADGLAKCGRRRGDLGALAEHLAAPAEPDAGVRQRAWDSYLLITGQLPPEEQIKISDEFDRPTDKVAQRRRMEILKPLATDTRAPGNQGAQAAAGKFEQLSKMRRLEVVERIADAQWNLGEFSTSALSLDQAISLLEETAGPRFVALASRCVAARLKAHEDALALQRMSDLSASDKDDPACATAMANRVFEELRFRIDAAVEAAQFADALGLGESARPLLRKIGGTQEEQLSALRQDMLAKRAAAMDRLLEALGTDSDAEPKLLGFPKEIVLVRLGARLKSIAATSAPATDLEDRWIQLAKRLVPGWQSWPADSTTQDRAAAIDKLLNGAGSAKATNGSSNGRTPPESTSIRAQGNVGEP